MSDTAAGAWVLGITTAAILALVTAWLQERNRPAPRPVMAEDHRGPWSIRFYDDAPESGSVVMELDREGVIYAWDMVPAYKVWTALAHWAEDLDAWETAHQSGDLFPIEEADE